MNWIFIWIQGASNVNGWQASINKSINELDCIPNVHCTNWTTANPRFVSKFDNEVVNLKPGFLKTRSWHCDNFKVKLLIEKITTIWLLDLPEYITDGLGNFISPAISLNRQRPGQLEFTLSILAEDKFEILLTNQEDWKWKPAIIVHLASSENWIGWCSQVTNNSKCATVGTN